MNTKFRASVIVPSYNGARKIGNLLDGLIRQSPIAVEIIVVIDGSTDNSREILKEYQRKFATLLVIEQNNGGRSIARNSGARAATGALYIFYDDDMTPEPDSLEQHITFHNGCRGILCGDVVEIPGTQKTDIQNYKAWLTDKWTAAYPEGLTRMTADRLFFTAANCSIPKDLFWQLGGFDEDLTDVEDYDLALRALENHVPVYYDKSNKAVHNEVITCKSYIRRLREYGSARRKLKSPNANKAETRLAQGNAKSIVYAFFSFTFWVRLVDAGIFVFLPRGLRFRLYSIIIQALANERTNVPL